MSGFDQRGRGEENFEGRGKVRGDLPFPLENQGEKYIPCLPKAYASGGRGVEGKFFHELRALFNANFGD